MPDLIGRLLPIRRSARWDDAVEAIRGGAAYLAQGSSYSYLRARTLLAGPRLFSDDDFAFALNICKWEGFAVAAQDLILIIEADMRAALPDDATRRRLIGPTGSGRMRGPSSTRGFPSFSRARR